MCRSTCLLLLLPSLIVLAPAYVRAHGDIHEQISAVTQQIAESPDNAGLYLKRGELHSQHSNWRAALDDYHRAAQLNPTLTIVDLAQGKTLLNAGQFESSKEAFDRFLANEPDRADALASRARALAELGQPEASIADYTRAIGTLARLGHPDPDYYLERAQLIVARGDDHVPEALGGLDEGIAVLGPLATLQLYAIELELSVGRTQLALARLNSVAAHSNRPESWLARRGEILERAGRIGDARAAYEQALAAIDALAPRHRRTRATRELETRLRGTLARLQ